MHPTVSVILPVYNGEETVALSIRSVLTQSYDDFELIIINDGSKDTSESIISSVRDRRIRVYDQENRGLAATLNRGVELAEGRYIARIDQDDAALTERLGRQVAFLDAHPSVAMVGTWADIYVGQAPSGRFHKHPSSCDALRVELLLDNPFVHSSVMMRTEVVRSLRGYRSERATRFPEDYELWSRIARAHEVANLPEVLTIYRETPGSISRAGAVEILANVIKISAENIALATGGRVSKDECLGLSEFYHGVAMTQTGLPRLLAIWKLAAEGAGGQSSGWTSECRSTYRRVRRQILSRYLRQRLPPKVLQLARSLVRRS